LRRPSTSSTVAGAVARGEVLGRRLRGSNADSPSARYRATNSYTHDRATPYSATTSATVGFSTVIAVITNRAFDMPEHQHRCPL
jgi:hypothetical protein